MEYRRFGKSDLKVSRIGLGSWQFGSPGWLFTDRNMMKKVVNQALDLGVIFIDTAEIYGDGVSEEVIGEVIKERGDRDDLVIATKVSGAHLQYRDVFKAAENSLKRLQIDVIDLYQIHWPSSYVPISETMKALDKLLKNGKIRYVGLSNFPVCSIKEAMESLKNGDIISNQIRYNIVQRDIEKEILPFMRKEGIVTIPYSPLAMGLLTGKYDESTEFPKEDLRSRHPLFKNKNNLKQVLTVVAVIREIAEKHNATVAQIALSWLLKMDDMFPIPGAKKPEHVEQNVRATEIKLSDDEWNKITQISDNLNLEYF